MTKKPEEKTLEEYKKTIIANYPTLRDGFAMAALPGLINVNSGYSNEQLAQKAYLIADAMLKCRA